MTKKAKHWKEVCDTAAKAAVVSGPRDVAKVIRGVIESTNGYAFEHIVAVFLDSQHRIIGHALCGVGRMDGSEFVPAVMFKRFFQTDGATCIILGHNHPSGALFPSEQDRVFAKKVAEVSAMLGVAILDNLIVTHEGYVSFN